MEIHHKMCCSKHWDRHNHFTTTHLMIIVYTPPFYMVLTTFLYMWVCSVLRGRVGKVCASVGTADGCPLVI